VTRRREAAAFGMCAKKKAIGPVAARARSFYTGGYLARRNSTACLAARRGRSVLAGELWRWREIWVGKR
jgi:hypothetical protein